MSAITLSTAPELAPETSPAPAEAALVRSRASWSGLLRFGLVALPVKAFPAAASSHDVHFNQLHAGCGQRIRYEKHCPCHGRVEAGAIASGYAIAPDQYVVVDEAELEKLRPAKDKALALERFLDAGHVDPALFSGRSLYLAPDGPAAHRPYVVLTQALHQHHKWAVGRVVLSGRRHLALVRPVGRVLALHLLHYPAQLRATALVEADVRPEAATPEELELAGLLIKAASQATLCWSEYRDDTAEGLRALVVSLAQGQPVVTAPVDEAPVLSLLEALKRSVGEATGKSPAAETPPPQGRKGKKAPSRRSA